MIEAPLVSRCTAVRHGFFGRTGGTSSGIHASLNVGLGSRDDRRCVIANRALVAGAFNLPPAKLLTLYQIHSADSVIVEDASDTRGTRADGMVTGRPGLALGILTADCAPVLFADDEAGVIGAAHAGWSGALKGIVDSVVDSMVAIGARRERIVAAVGPAIARESYEVGPEYRQRFEDDDPGNGRFFVPSSREGRLRFDLPSYVLHRLSRCGIDHCAWTGGDTCLEEERYFSFRRSVLRNEGDYGRQISVICLSG